ncbi:iron uptake system protein EfeO [Mumia zhuanghuii]|uniref:Peptidase M75 family protein n=1 Tax=Mumia zhuanghuii TaxID=2585211 RepID=A0A5C4MGD8_9ACTN|nr:iron uptake system protein EfeO [Mumia zhuanghuii]TNC36440.1 peptidase M75 family protein [Mumia zhuanghuii]TNC42407.1 peptidase M75 family protein [Mumia zhuanghuii]
MRRTPLPVTLGLVALSVGVLAGCTENRPVDSDDDRSLQVTSTADACEVSSGEAPAGNLRFSVRNEGTDVTEFYLLASDGLRIIGEIENIGPGLTRDLVVTAPEGKYVTACKPGMKGEGIRDDFAVTASDEDVAVSGDTQALVDQANKNYAAYVQDQSAQLLDQTTEFVALYKAGKDAEARALYPVARQHWERIETVAESFGDLDPKMDAREADLEPGQRWTGWHLIEKDLWPARAQDYTALTPAERTTYADDLLANTQTLDDRVQDLTYTVDQIANGSRGLLDEVATGKVTGEEEYWSRTDLWDFQANVDGARVAFEGVQPIVEKNDEALATEIADRFDALQALLDTHKQGDGFVTYDQLTTEHVKALSDAVNALSEPLSKLAAATV